MAVEISDPAAEFDAILQLPADVRSAALVALAQRLVASGESKASLSASVAAALAALLEEGHGTPAERLVLGEALGWIGDPRLRTPDDAEYWVDIETDDGPVKLARFPVTNAEFQRFIDSGAYRDPTHWSADGVEWLSRCVDPWPTRRKASDSQPFVVPNQPVVGITWFEADAYARWADARLPRFDERLAAVRGSEKRPYPWGSPFGEGNANTQEEGLRRPCAVGLYLGDRTPEGVCDLAGNVGEWSQDGVGHGFWYAPGSWDQPSMAAWAKARELEAPAARSPGLGFRLARD